MLRPIALAALLLAPPAAARTEAEGLSPFGDAARRFVEGLTTELAPAIRELRELVDDFSNYEMPQMQPNGDIIIRRKPEAAPPPGPGEIDI